MHISSDFLNYETNLLRSQLTPVSPIMNKVKSIKLLDSAPCSLEFFKILQSTFPQLNVLWLCQKCALNCDLVNAINIGDFKLNMVTTLGLLNNSDFDLQFLKRLLLMLSPKIRQLKIIGFTEFKNDFEKFQKDVELFQIRRQITKVTMCYSSRCRIYPRHPEDSIIDAFKDMFPDADIRMLMGPF